MCVPSSVLWVKASKLSEWNHESHETHEKEDRGQASDSLAERVRHPAPRDVHRHDPLLFRVFRAFRGWIPACLVGETATDERDAHTGVCECATYFVIVAGPSIHRIPMILWLMIL